VRVSADRPRYVLDSFALLAYFGAEPGEPQVKAVLAQIKADQPGAYLSVINYGELIYIIEREQGAFAARRAIAAVDQLPITVIEADRRLTFAAARVKAHYRLSYADAFAVALAQQTQAALLTGDPEFRAVEHLITIEWLPENVTG
jgi:predicted nucleic acid-binding protein